MLQSPPVGTCTSLGALFRACVLPPMFCEGHSVSILGSTQELPMLIRISTGPFCLETSL